MAGNDDLHKPLLNIQRAVGKVEQAVISLSGVVEQVRDAIVEGTTEIRDAIHENIRAQAELRLMEHMMEVRSVKPQLEAEHDQISAEREELAEQLESIDDRYGRKHAELDETASERIRDLGSHIFEINEREFEEGIETTFTEQVTSAWHVLQAHNEDVRDDREERLHETTGEVVQRISDYLDRQEALLETIGDHHFDRAAVPVDGDDPERVQLPYYVVEYEVDGTRKRTRVVPSELSPGGTTEWRSVSLAPLSGVEELLADAPAPEATDVDSSLSRGDVRAAASRYGASKSLGPSYEEAAMAAMPDDAIPVRTAGGEH